MKKNLFASIAVAAVAGAVAIPSIVLGNAARTAENGPLAAQHAAETPYIAQLSGANEVPTAGDPDGTGAAAVSFHALESGYRVCWDLSYSGIGDPIAAHIHKGAAGVPGDVVIAFFMTPDTASLSGCTDATVDQVNPILADPASYYVNIHTDAHQAGAIRGQLAKGPAPAGSTHLLPSPLRAYDSREQAAGKLKAFEERTISLATGKNPAGDMVIAVPPGATAALITLTATETEAPGYLVVYSAASPLPTTSNLNWVQAIMNVAVGTQTAVDSSASIKVASGPSATDFIVDVVGYLY